MLAHEMHHVMRMRRGAWAYSLGDRFVSEGLAQCFEEEVGAPTPFYAVALDDKTMKKMAARARPLLSATDYDHNAWMFGRRNDPEWPRNTGYSLGYALVSAWLAKKDLSRHRRRRSPGHRDHGRLAVRSVVCFLSVQLGRYSKPQAAAVVPIEAQRPSRAPKQPSRQSPSKMVPSACV